MGLNRRFPGFGYSIAGPRFADSGTAVQTLGIDVAFPGIKIADAGIGAVPFEEAGIAAERWSPICGH